MGNNTINIFKEIKNVQHPSMHMLSEKIFDIKEKITDEEYLCINNLFKNIYDSTIVVVTQTKLIQQNETSDVIIYNKFLPVFYVLIISSICISSGNILLGFSNLGGQCIPLIMVFVFHCHIFLIFYIKLVLLHIQK